MTTLLTKIQLFVFGLVTVAAVSYGAVQYLDVRSFLSPPYTVEAQFETPGGIYVRADVELLGVRVGRVTEIRPGPDTGTTVVMALDDGTEVPQDIEAAIASKSAIGEPYVALTPRSADGPLLREGDVITTADTVSPPDFADLLRNTDELVSSLPQKDLAVALEESAAAVRNLGPTLGRLLDDADTVTRASLENVAELNRLIDGANTVLATQVELGPQTSSYLSSLGSLTGTLAELNPTVLALFSDGVTAAREVSSLMLAIRQPLPALLNQLVVVNDIAGNRLPAVRKTLAIFPWVLEVNGNSLRPCDEYDAVTGKPVQSTCRFDENGDPVYSAHLAIQPPQPPEKPPYLACTKGYEGTVKYAPDGTPVTGGARQRQDSEPNLEAGCTAAPTDPVSPNVRGSQNVR